MMDQLPMDLHILIVIACVVVATLLSMHFLNKLGRNRTFEEIAAEKRAIAEKINAQARAIAKKPKKMQQMKKELKREKKQRQKEQQRSDNTTEQDDSDGQSDQASAEEELPPGLSKTHVEFNPDPEVLSKNIVSNDAKPLKSSGADKENLGAKSKLKKSEKKGGKSTGGILINKNEPVAIKTDQVVTDEPVNNFEINPPKDVIELKKFEKEKEKDKKDDKQQKKEKTSNKKDKHVVIDNKATAATVATSTAPATVAAVEQPIEIVHVAKDLKQAQLDDKPRHVSPKHQQNGHTNNVGNKGKQQNKKQNKETSATKELIVALDKLSENDTISVSLLMNLFRRAELNRSEIQILIDYLLNKQQDMPSSHSEWSDDICQKLKRQLEEKERQLAEEQESSIGIQAKLRDLRTEINSERAQMNATIKAYVEKIQSKEQEVTALNQELQALNEKLTVERQQFQTKLIREKQAGSQDLLAQLQIMQNELAHKDKCIGELTCMVNASRQAVEESQQKNEIIQSQVQQIHALEQQRDELEQISNNRIFELEKAKTLETENAEYKVEVRNMQNALESLKADLTQAHADLETAKAALTHTLNMELGEKQKEMHTLRAKNEELVKQLAGISSKSEEQNKERTEFMDIMTAQIGERETRLDEFKQKYSALLKQLDQSEAKAQQQTEQQLELHKLVDTLKADMASKQKQLQEVEQIAEKLKSNEKELLQQLHEQKEKNNDLRMKNWKLIEALQNAETTLNKRNKMLLSENANLGQQEQLLTATQNSSASKDTSSKDQKQIRELFQRLYPEAVKACAGTALSVSFDQWIEQVLATHIKQSLSKSVAAASSSHKSTQSNSTVVDGGGSNSNYNRTAAVTSSTNNNLSNSDKTTSNNNNNNSNSRISGNATSGDSSSSSNNKSSSNNNSSDAAEMQKLQIHNAQLRVKIDELTKLVTKTSNTLSDLEGRAREQDEHWRSVVRSKDDQIYMLQHLNGEQDI